MNNHLKKLSIYILLLMGVLYANLSSGHQLKSSYSNTITKVRLSTPVIRHQLPDNNFTEQSPLNKTENNNLLYSECEDENDNNDDTSSENPVKDNIYLSAQNYFNSLIYDHFLRHIYSRPEPISYYQDCVPLSDIHIFILFSIIRI